MEYRALCRLTSQRFHRYRVSEHPHYFATERRTMCGVLVGARSSGFLAFTDFLSAYQSNPHSVCPQCLRCMRRFMHYRGPLQAAFEAYCHAHGFVAADLPPVVWPY